MLTARKDDETFGEAKKLGAEAFLTKPVKREQLLQEVAFRLAQRLAKPR